MGKKRTKKKAEDQDVIVTPKKKTAYSVFQEKSSIPIRVTQSMTAGKKRKVEKSSAKKVKEAMKLESNMVEEKDDLQPKSTNLYARNFFKMLSRKIHSKPVDPVSIASEKQPAAEPKEDNKESVCSEGRAEHSKKGRKRRRGKKTLSVKKGLLMCSGVTAEKIEGDGFGEQSSITKSGAAISKADRDDVGEFIKTSIRISPRLKSKDILQPGRSEPKDSQELKNKSAVYKKRKASDSKNDSTALFTPRSVSLKSKRTPRSKKKVKKDESVKIQPSVDLEEVPFVPATGNEDGYDKIVSDVDHSVQETSLDDEASMELMEDDYSAECPFE
jgi:hypothetical protein